MTNSILKALLPLEPHRFSMRLKAAILFFALTGHFLVSFLVTEAGHLNEDEGVYHMMAHSLAKYGSFSIWNGLEDIPSKELVPLSTQVVGEQLSAQYPYLFIFIALPLYLLAGLKGLFLLNALAFACTVAICFLMAEKALNDRNLALNTCLIFVFATFSWEYSQAVWPHSTAVFFVVTGFYLAFLGYREDVKRLAIIYALLAGIFVGVGAGVRLDCIIILPAIFLPFIFSGRFRISRAIASFIGLVPGLLLLAWTNYLKFYEFSPFTYGAANNTGVQSITAYIPILIMGISGLVLLWILTREKVQLFIRKHWITVLFMAVVACVVGSLSPMVMALGKRLINGLYCLVIDLRALPVESAWVRQFLERGPTGGIFSPFQGLKKSLLQSCPYLVLLLIPAFSFFRERKDRVILGALFVASLSYIIVFSYMFWHGGSSLNMRYFLPALPFTSILTAYAWRDLWHQPGRPGADILCGIGAIALIGIWRLIKFKVSPEMAEYIILVVPLAVAALLLFFVLGHMVLKSKMRRLLVKGAMFLSVGAFAFSSVMAFSYDYPRAKKVRAFSAASMTIASEHIEDDSLLFLPSYYPFSAYIEGDRIRFAAPLYDGFKDFRQLSEFHLAAGRPVYVWVDPNFRKYAKQDNLPNDFTLTPLGRSGNRILARMAFKH